MLASPLARHISVVLALKSVALVERYLNPQHRDRPETNCAIAALGREIARSEPAAHHEVVRCLG